jgi:PDZ domain-containing secreted protein
LVPSILPSSKAKGIIHVGAMIHVVDGQEVHKTSGFIDIMKKKVGERVNISFSSKGVIKKDKEIVFIRLDSSNNKIGLAMVQFLL